MLQQRITYQEKGFQLYADENDTGRTAWYTTFALKDARIEKAQTKKIGYWTPLNSVVVEIPNRTFVCIWEIRDGEEVEEYSFYFTNGNVKPQLGWRIDRAKPYGENAWMITLEWLSHTYDSIHKSHIWLKNKKTGKKFAFLKETIGPLEPNGSVLKDQYIILLPEGVSVNDLAIEGDELLRQKYLFVKN